MCIDEEQGRRAVHIAKRRNGPEQGGAVATVDEWEATSLQDRSNPAVDGVHHLQQRSLVHEAGQRTSGRIGFGHDDVGADPCAGESRGKSGVTEPRWCRRLSQRATGAIEADADEVDGIVGESGLRNRRRRHVGVVYPIRQASGPASAVSSGSAWGAVSRNGTLGATWDSGRDGRLPSPPDPIAAMSSPPGMREPTLRFSLPQDGITDGSVVLRMPTEDDIDGLLVAVADPELREAANMPNLSHAEALASIAHLPSLMASGRMMPMTALDTQTGDAVGGGILHHLDGERGIVEIGYWVLPAARGAGSPRGSLACSPSTPSPSASSASPPTSTSTTPRPSACSSGRLHARGRRALDAEARRPARRQDAVLTAARRVTAGAQKRSTRVNPRQEECHERSHHHEPGADQPLTGTTTDPRARSTAGGVHRSVPWDWCD